LLFEDNDAADLSEKLGLLFDNSDYHRILGTQAASRAEQFGWKAIADRVLGVYQDLSGQLNQEVLVGSLL
jgi:glycosyltransferase involved in cell wall biosynthesis